MLRTAQTQSESKRSRGFQLILLQRDALNVYDVYLLVT